MADKLTRFTWERLVIGPDGPLDPICRHVLLTLGTHVNRKLECWPTAKLLAEETGHSERTVREYLTTAEQEGWIHRVPRKTGGQAWRNYLYTLTVPFEGAAERAARRQKAAARAAAAKQELSGRKANAKQEGAAAGAERAADYAEGAAADDMKVRLDVPLNNEVLNTSINNKGNTSGSGSPSASPAQTPFSDLSKSGTVQKPNGAVKAVVRAWQQEGSAEYYARREELIAKGKLYNITPYERETNNELAARICIAMSGATT
jgi:hypothetical protein